jgi:two-component sensor histidine kinase
MATPSSTAGERKSPLTIPFIVLVSLWATLIVALAVWDYLRTYISTLENAQSGARDSFNKDLSYRRWAAVHGGVYVPITPETPPNPYLAHIPERDISTPSGKKLTLMNPAYMTRQVLELAQQQYGTRGHITSLRPIRPENAPDEWEKEALTAFERGEKEVLSLNQVGNETYLRLMRPLITEPDCLICHGGQGYKAGDILGGISVSVFWGPYRETLLGQLRNHILGYVGIWVIGTLGLWFGRSRLEHYLSERLRAESALRTSLAEKEVLLKEVHHRVKNNLAAIMGLLDLQGQKLNDEPARTALAELSARIRSMALVHEQLYQSEDFSRIDFQDYLEALIAHLRSSYEQSGDIHVSVAAAGVEMDLDSAVPCGLLITELVTNALKYAFPAGRPRPGTGGCEIAVSAEWDDTAYTLTVADNGVGLPADHNWANTKTLGLLLVKMLGQHQLQGRIELDRTGGTSFRLRFTPKDAHMR